VPVRGAEERGTSGSLSPRLVRPFPKAMPFPLFDKMILPSPVRRLVTHGNGNELWLKDDSHIHPIYGGNKCRKLARLLPEAGRKGVARVTTFGTAGSHHVLATGLLAQACGFSVRAFVISQPWSQHAEQVLRASVASGIELVPVNSLQQALTAVSRLTDSGAWIPPGGTNVCGSLGYFDAVCELAAQIQRGEVPEPDWIVVPFGTGGTAAGLLAGVAMTGLGSKVLGVSVVKIAGRTWVAHRIAGRILRLADSRRRVGASKLVVTTQWLGGGYGKQARDGVMATERAQSFDLPLDPSYTAKAFAGAWALLEGTKLNNYDGRSPTMPPVPQKILYWHTLSAPCQLESTPSGAALLPRPLGSLLRPCPRS